jgi:ketosteroid isomerase-like protein
MKKLASFTVIMALALLTNAQLAAAQASDESAVAQAVEAYRNAMLASDRNQLEAICADQMSYGHSSGKVETKAQFIEGSRRERLAWKWITLGDQTIQIVGSNAIVRNLFTGEYASEGKTVAVKIGILMVWQKQDGRWKLLARQAYKL